MGKNRSSLKPVGPPLHIYRAQARGAATYGSELWGHAVSHGILKEENRFIRCLVGLPPSTPLVPLRMDLGIRPLDEELALRPLIYWRRLWAVPELISYRQELQEVLSIPHSGNILWLKFVRKSLEDLGLHTLWTDPLSVCTLTSNKTIAKVYHGHKRAALLARPNLGTLTESFLTIKDNYSLELALDKIYPVLLRKLYLQWRHGSLPICTFTSKWNEVVSPRCPACRVTDETEPHLMFFCPAYREARKKWIIPICRNLGFTKCTEALRILKVDLSEFIVFAVAKYLNAVWHYRRQCLKLAH